MVAAVSGQEFDAMPLLIIQSNPLPLMTNPTYNISTQYVDVLVMETALEKLLRNLFFELLLIKHSCLRIKRSMHTFQNKWS